MCVAALPRDGQQLRDQSIDNTREPRGALKRAFIAQQVDRFFIQVDAADAGALLLRFARRGGAVEPGAADAVCTSISPSV